MTDKKPEAKRGTCPVCHRRYHIKDDGFLQRHTPKPPAYGGGNMPQNWRKCFQDDLLPLELLRAVVAISRIGRNENGQSAQ